MKLENKKYKDLKLRIRLRHLNEKEIKIDGFGWEVVGLDELTYLTYPKEDRYYVEDIYKFIFNNGGSMNELTRIKLLFYLRDELYNWLFKEKRERLKDEVILNELLEKRFEELVVMYDKWFKKLEKHEQYTIID